MGQHSAITCIEQTQVQAVHAALPYSEKVPTRYCQERALVFQQFQTNVDIVDMKKTPQERALYIPGAIFKKKNITGTISHGTWNFWQLMHNKTCIAVFSVSPKRIF